MQCMSVLGWRTLSTVFLCINVCHLNVSCRFLTFMIVAKLGFEPTISERIIAQLTDIQLFAGKCRDSTYFDHAYPTFTPLKSHVFERMVTNVWEDIVGNSVKGLIHKIVLPRHERMCDSSSSMKPLTNVYHPWLAIIQSKKVSVGFYDVYVPLSLLGTSLLNE